MNMRRIVYLLTFIALPFMANAQQTETVINLARERKLLDDPYAAYYTRDEEAMAALRQAQELVRRMM